MTKAAAAPTPMPASAPTERLPGSELALVSMADGVDVGKLGAVGAGVDADIDVEVVVEVDVMRSDACHLITTPNAFNSPPPVIDDVSKSFPGVRVV